jgi:ribonuclease HI
MTKWYVVWYGRVPGVYETWEACQAHIHNVRGAKYKSFLTYEAAVEAYAEGHEQHIGKRRKQSNIVLDAPPYIVPSLCVDVGTYGNPGRVMYRGVATHTGLVVFESPPIPYGTNNLGEFVAIVHGLAYIEKNGLDMPVYTDSVNARNWVRRREVRSTLERDTRAITMWTLVDRALQWLYTHRDHATVLQWDTKAWGQIKADYDRK